MKNLALTAATLATAAASGVVAQFEFITTGGQAVAATGSHFNKPTSSWKQWQPKPTYALSDLPDQYMGANRAGPTSDDQSGFNRCAKNAWNQQSLCQTAYVNSLDDFCIFGPPTQGAVGAMERVAVAYCTTAKYGTRLIPDGTILSAQFVKTPDYVQITALGDFTSIGVPFGDEGGEMDSAGADDLENPIGGVVYTNAMGSSNSSGSTKSSTSKSNHRKRKSKKKGDDMIMSTHWSEFLSWNKVCFRVCTGKNAAEHCQHIYDILGCDWNMPTLPFTGFESCDGDNAMFQGIYEVNGKNSTFHQGDPSTPLAHPAPSVSNCKTVSTISNGLLKATPVAGATGANSAATLSGSAFLSAVSVASSSLAASGRPGGAAAAALSPAGSGAPSSAAAGAFRGSQNSVGVLMLAIAVSSTVLAWTVVVA